MYALSLALAIIIPADILRLNSTRFEWLFERCLGFLMRESEKVRRVLLFALLHLTLISSEINQRRHLVHHRRHLCPCRLSPRRRYRLHPYVRDPFVPPIAQLTVFPFLSLSWADTAASTVGRLWGAYTPPLPRSIPLVPFIPFLRLPLAPRKSLAGFIAGSLTGAAIAVGFWGLYYPVRDAELTFRLPMETIALVQDALPDAAAEVVERGVEWVQSVGAPLGRWVGLATLGVVSGLISGTAEALGTSFFMCFSGPTLMSWRLIDLGSLDDNLTLPIISGGCIWGFFKVLEYFSGSA